MNTLRHIRLKHPWKQWSKGHVFTGMTNGQTEIMVKLGRAEYVVPETKSPIDRMMRPFQRSSTRATQISKE